MVLGEGRGWLVEQQPVQPKRLHRLDELVEINWLDDVTVDAKVVALDDVALFPRGGQDDNR